MPVLSATVSCEAEPVQAMSVQPFRRRHAPFAGRLHGVDRDAVAIRRVARRHHHLPLHHEELARCGGARAGGKRMGRAPKHFTSRWSTSAHAPGDGSIARIRRATAAAGSFQRIRAVSRSTRGATVARASSWGTGRSPAAIFGSASTRAAAPTVASRANSDPAVSSSAIGVRRSSQTAPVSSPASTRMIDTPVSWSPASSAH